MASNFCDFDHLMMMVTLMLIMIEVVMGMLMIVAMKVH